MKSVSSFSSIDDRKFLLVTQIKPNLDNTVGLFHLANAMQFFQSIVDQTLSVSGLLSMVSIVQFLGFKIYLKKE